MKKNNIDKLLKERGESITRLADKMDKTYSGIYRLVKKDDLTGVTLGTLTLVADFLNVTIEDLYTEEKDNNIKRGSKQYG